MKALIVAAMVGSFGLLSVMPAQASDLKIEWVTVVDKILVKTTNISSDPITFEQFTINGRNEPWCVYHNWNDPAAFTYILPDMLANEMVKPGIVPISFTLKRGDSNAFYVMNCGTELLEILIDANKNGDPIVYEYSTK